MAKKGNNAKEEQAFHVVISNATESVQIVPVQILAINMIVRWYGMVPDEFSKRSIPRKSFSGVEKGNTASCSIPVIWICVLSV